MREIVSVTRRSLATALLALSPAVVQQRAALAVQAERVDPVTGKLVLTQPPTINIQETPPVITSRCFLDVSIGGTPHTVALRVDNLLYHKRALPQHPLAHSAPSNLKFSVDFIIFGQIQQN